MAHSSNAGADTGRIPAGFVPTPQFKPFSWWESTSQFDLHQQHYASFLDDARDVVQGAQTLAELLNWDEVRRELAHSPADPAPIFSAFHRGSLERLLIASLGLLGRRIESQCDLLAQVGRDA